MSLAADIANKSIREAISTIANAVDSIKPVDAQGISELSVAVNDLKAEVKALNLAINGEPGSGGGGGEQPPVTPV